MDKKELIAQLKISITQDLLDAVAAENDNSYKAHEAFFKSIHKLNQCESVNDIASFCKELAWDIDSFLSFLFKELFDEEWDIDNLHSAGLEYLK